LRNVSSAKPSVRLSLHTHVPVPTVIRITHQPFSRRLVSSARCFSRGECARRPPSLDAPDELTFASLRPCLASPFTSASLRRRHTRLEQIKRVVTSPERKLDLDVDSLQRTLIDLLCRCRAPAGRHSFSPSFRHTFLRPWQAGTEQDHGAMTRWNLRGRLCPPCDLPRGRNRRDASHLARMRTRVAARVTSTGQALPLPTLMRPLLPSGSANQDSIRTRRMDGDLGIPPTEMISTR
jgi:hypothetical protein